MASARPRPPRAPRPAAAAPVRRRVHAQPAGNGLQPPHVLALAVAPVNGHANSRGDGGAHPTLDLLRSRSLGRAAQQEIEHLILSGAIRPGERLIEAHLSQRLGVSRGPIREAFRMLEEDGLVRQEKNRGVFVRAIALDEAAEIYDLRAAMDELVGRRLGGALAPPQLKALRVQVDTMDQSARAGDADTYHRLNLQFHDTLVEFAGNRKLTAIYRKLVKELALFRRRNLEQHAVLPHSVAEHRAILKAIAAGDAAGAARLLYEHAIAGKERMLTTAVATDAAASLSPASARPSVRPAARPSTARSAPAAHVAPAPAGSPARRVASVAATAATARGRR
jgi:phosphonate utilization transcriptional regulator